VIFLDTNVLVEALGRPESERVATRQAAAQLLLTQVAEGVVAATTSEAILVEAAKVLADENSYGLPVQDVAAYLTAFVSSVGLRLEPKRIYVRAFDLWTERPSLGFVDALTIAYAEQGDVQLASFDRRLLASPGITPYWT
jgi:predicted nucleic acid-binding protein